MKRLTVEPLSLPEDLELLHSWPLALRRKQPFKPPRLMRSLRNALDPRVAPWFSSGEARGWIARINGEPAGSIVAHLTTVDGGEAAEVEGEGRIGLFGYLETTDDQAVVSSLISAAREWLGRHGATEIAGPVDVAPMLELGALTNGFDTPPFTGTTWSPEFLPPMLKNAGLSASETTLGWSWRLPTHNRVDNHDWNCPRGETSVRTSTRGRLKQDVSAILALAGARCEGELLGFHPFSMTSPDQLIVSTRYETPPRRVWLLERDDEVIGGAIVQNDLNPVITSMGGRIFPFGWLSWLFRHRRAYRARLMAITISREHEERELLQSFLRHVARELSLEGIHDLEISPVPLRDRLLTGVLRGVGAQESKRWTLFRGKLDDE